MEPTPSASVERLRAKWLNELPRWYLPLAHFLATVGICTAAVLISSRHLTLGGLTAALVVLGNLVFANFFEWLTHKYAMHRPMWPLKVLYQKHTVMHHKLYREDDMALRHWRELAFILIPAPGILGVVVTAAMVCSVLGLAFGAGVGWLAILTQSAYVLTYELSHLTYHLPLDHPIRRIPGHRWLASRHALHHNPKMMMVNYNITVPLADIVIGTYRKPK